MNMDEREQPALRKKHLILSILEILRTHTDAEHRLLQAQIMELLEQDYGLTATRKSVRENIRMLCEAGYPLVYDDGWYYEHEFTTAELNLMIDTLLTSGAVPETQLHQLIDKLRVLGGAHYHPAPGGAGGRPVNPQFLYTLDVLHEAMEKGLRVKYQYADYDVDKKLHPRLRKNGEIKKYDVTPYRIVQNRGRYYLIGNVQKYTKLSHYRVDRIQEIRILDKPAKPLDMVEPDGLDSYEMGRPFMYTGRKEKHRLKIRRSIVGALLDSFGMDVSFRHVTAEDCEAIVTADERSLGYWLAQYAGEAERLEWGEESKGDL